ncbi:hypothetical protein QQ045_012437 [Rhodiola kirilowii]
MASLGISEASSSRSDASSGGSSSGSNVDDPYSVSNNEMTVFEKIVGEILHSNDVMTAWENLESSYAGTNLVRKSTLLRELSDCVLNGMHVCEYNRKLNSLYQEIDAINTVKCFAIGNCLCCKQFDVDKQGDRVVRCLMGLDDCYASLRTNVFVMTEVPKRVTVYGYGLSLNKRIYKETH